MRSIVFVVGLIFITIGSPANGSEETGTKNAPGGIITIDSDRTFDQDLNVKDGQKLVIKPGVTLKFAEGAGIVSLSVVEAKGTAEEPIVFTASDPAKGWKNLSLVGPGTGGSVLEHCHFSQGRGCRAKFEDKTMAFTGFAKPDDKDCLVCGGAIFVCAADKIEITSCRFEKNSAFWAGAVMCWDKASPKITGCYFADNKADEDAGAIQCAFRSSPTISGNYIVRNSAKWGGAIHCLARSSPVISSNYIAGNKSKSNGGAVSCFNRAEPTFTENYIAGNESETEKGGAIAAIVHSKPVLKANFIGENKDKSGEGKGLWANDTFKDQKDESTCQEETSAGKEAILKLLKDRGVLDLAPQQNSERDKSKPGSAK